MATEMSGMTKVAHNLLLLSQQRATGELVITHGKQTSLRWKLYFFLGRIVYATGGMHPVRRWYRAFKHSCSECFNSGWLLTVHSEADLWEVDLLNQAIQQKRISATQYKAVIQSVVQEVVFTAIAQKFFSTQWNSGKHIPQQITFLSVEQAVREAHHLREQWRDCGLGFLQELMAHFSPDLSPTLRNRPQLESQVSPATYKSMLKLMRGQYTLWDLALEMQKPLPIVIRSLLPLIRLGMIELKEIPDLPSLCTKPATVFRPAVKPAIACIDANPITGSTITQILQPLGYEVLTILNPLQGIVALAERKPKLIFLDPVMTNADGYELCSFLRTTSDFQHTPIVFLTQHDGVVDRVRARLAGASEFLAKPPESAKVIQVVQKYLRPMTSPEPNSQSNWVVA